MSTMKEFPRRFLSLRDKSANHHRSKSAPPGSKPRPQKGDNFRNFFKGDHGRTSLSKEEEAEKEMEDAKIRAIQQRLEGLGYTNIATDHIREVLGAAFAQGDPDKTVDFIDIAQKSDAGVIFPYDPHVVLVGAENRNAVTCYLDSLLFSMFVKMDAFECILKGDFPSDAKKAGLVYLLRIWVNMLRSGKLIRTDLTKRIQESLALCGWEDARELEQQDTSEAFAFLTETLKLPLLSLQVDLFHQGKGDKDDHKVVYERLLNLAVPPDSDGKGIRLEDCLEDYFNTQVDVLRDSEEAKKSTTDERRSPIHRNTIRILTEETQPSTNISASPVALSPPPFPDYSSQTASGSATPEQPSAAQKSSPQATKPDVDLDTAEDIKDQITRRPSTRARSASVIQSVVLDDSGRRSSADHATLLQKARRKGSTVVKAVTIPAWQFFRLIPWHAVNSSEPQNDMEVKMNFDQRPVVGICLKRYAMTESGTFKRHDTYIDIPDSMRLPHFMLADDSREDLNDLGGLNMDYKLVLQSVICHRGVSVQSGHYIAFARVDSRVITDNRRHDSDPPPDYEEAQWVLFDDLNIENRVTYVDNIKESLKMEMPYLLFYQVVPMVGVDSASAAGSASPGPPSYHNVEVSVEQSTPPPPPTSGVVRPTDEYFNESSVLQSPPSKPPSIRLSSEIDRPRKSVEGTASYSYAGSTLGESRRQSMNLTDSTAVTPAVTPDGHSPVISPMDESTGSRLSRAASRFANRGSKSRPTSQYGDGRVGLTMSRVAGMMMRPTSKEPLADPTTLSISTSNHTGRASSENSRDPEPKSSVEIDKLQPSSSFNNHLLKNGAKTGKSKERPGKEKAHGDQPERECTVM